MLHTLLADIALLLAQGQQPDKPRNYAISWAIIMLSVVLGMLAALRAPKREERVKKPKPS